MVIVKRGPLYLGVLRYIFVPQQEAEVFAVNSDHDSPRHAQDSGTTETAVRKDSSSRPSSGKNSKTSSLDREGKKSKNASLGIKNGSGY